MRWFFAHKQDFSGSPCRTFKGRVIAALCLGVCLAIAPSRADDFDTIPSRDRIYSDLSDLRRAPWNTNLNAPDHSLTRYEVAIETARAILKISAPGAERASFVASRSSLRALRKLTEALRPELTRLDINVPDTLKLLDSLINNPVTEKPAYSSTPAPHEMSSLNGLPTHGTNLVNARVNVSQRLRVYSAVSSLARDADDPFGDTARFASHQAAPLARPGTLGAAVAGSHAINGALPRQALAGGIQAGASLALTDWMQVRADFAQNQLAPGTMAGDFRLRAPLLDGARAARSVGTGVDVALLGGLQFSGDVTRIAALGPDGDTGRRGTRFGGTLNLNAWQNRLSLSANLSRLVPEDAQILPSTAAEFNLGAEVTRRVSLNLTYQQMFSARSSNPNNRLVSGGISVKF
jgi:hypothetical protein